MEHRHLNHSGYTLAAIDSVITRGTPADWQALKAACATDPALLKKIEQVCRPNLKSEFDAELYQERLRWAENQHLPDTNTVMACGAFLEWAAPRFPVKAAILYGSRARGTHRQDSDADLAVVLERTDRRRLDIVKEMADLAFDVLLDTGISVSPLPVWIDEWEHPETHPNPALIENIYREGLALARPSIALRKHLASIPAIVSARRCANPRVFGSVLRGEDHIGSDLDLLVDPTESTTLLDLGGLQHDLIELLKVRVQIVTPGDLPDKWRQKVIDEAKPLDWS